MNLFILTAPYQFLNALEAIHYFGFTDNHLWVVDTGHFSRAQYESVINPRDWQTICHHNFRYEFTHLDFGASPPGTFREHALEKYLLCKQFLRRHYADRITAGVGPVDNLILGNYRRNYDGHMRHFANRIDYRHLFLLDVGTDTLRISLDREMDCAAMQSVQEQVPVPLYKRFWQKTKRALAEWDTVGAPALTFFTIYDIIPAGRDTVVRNEYNYLKSLMSQAQSTDSVYFVGQPLVDQGYLIYDHFRVCLKQIKDHFAGQKLVYIPHPRESERQVQAVIAAGLEVKRFSAPFEHSIAFSGERPCAIISFFSSVIENCAAIFRGSLKVQALRLPESILLKDQDTIARLYREFEQSVRKIEVIDVDINNIT